MELCSREVDSTSHAWDQLCHISGMPPISRLQLMSWSSVAPCITPKLPPELAPELGERLGVLRHKSPGQARLYKDSQL